MLDPQQSSFVMYDEEFQRISAVIEKLLRESNAKVIFLVDKNGQLIAGCGETDNLDTTSLASLTAGNIAATGGLAKLIGDGRLKVAPDSLESITFHDPCYLGRHNGITKEPRDLLKQLSGQSPVEMESRGEQSFCCGGGGGLSFVEEPSDQRVNVERAKQALQTGAHTVAVGCPFCTTMLEDGVGSGTFRRDRQRVDDVFPGSLYEKRPDHFPWRRQFGYFFRQCRLYRERHQQ